ncbi:hypothetical protein FB45DRAFT_887702 [Roridomyces roridus]|uniref:Uncharacterized protein n=1 Tax=Roridomyces roridus TaxID=1738132 RepID=A0AAD7CJ27_9AGAR|nr:hypothetical protein FB45DRAFT_887702 [Roridomyces roridus]
MSNHIRRNLHNRLDNADPLDTPTLSGFGSATVASQPEATANSLVLDGNPGAGPVGNPTGVAFSASATGTVTQPAEPALATTSSADDTATSAPASAQGSSSSSQISMGTVIGASLAALAGAVLIILIGLWLYKRATNAPRARRPSNAHKLDKDRAWGKLGDDEDKWEGKEGKPRVDSVGPMEKLTMFKKSTPSVRTNYTHSNDHEPLPPIAQFDHPFAQYHPNLAKELAESEMSEVPPQRPFLARVDAGAPISWDGDTVGRDSFLSLNSNPAVSAGADLALPTPQLTSSEPHHWESAEVHHFAQSAVVEQADDDEEEHVRRRKSSNNPFFGARMSTHSTRSRSQSLSRSRTPSLSTPSKTSLTDPDPVTMPAPPPAAFTREEKGKYRAMTPPSPTSSMAPSTILGHGANPFADPVLPSIAYEHHSQSSQDRALQSLIAALGPDHSAADVEERLRVASMNPSVLSESVYTEDGDAATLHQSWPIPPSRPAPTD